MGWSSDGWVGPRVRDLGRLCLLLPYRWDGDAVVRGVVRHHPNQRPVHRVKDHGGGRSCEKARSRNGSSAYPYANQTNAT